MEEGRMRMGWMMKISIGICTLLSISLLWKSKTTSSIDAFASSSSQSHRNSSVYLPQVALQPTLSMQLVETIPIDNFNLESTLAQTWEVLINRTNAATFEICLSAMYWNLLGTSDRKNYSDEEMKQFGADRGQILFTALVNAIKRGVRLRILTAKEEIDSKSNELTQLKALSPSSVVIHEWSGNYWYGGGILHHKIWIWDQQDMYIGSANMDWKSLSQVMEIGIWIQNRDRNRNPIVVDLLHLYEIWWIWADPSTKFLYKPQEYYSIPFQATLKVPPWSLSLENRVQPPFAWKYDALGNLSHQLQALFVSPSSPRPEIAHLFIAAAPKETSLGLRTFDQDALVYTIQTAQTYVYLSVMDFLPASMYSLSTHGGFISWPALTNAIIAGIFGKKGLTIRLLISEWLYSRKEIFIALEILKQQSLLCHPCNGNLEIKLFHVPGWNLTSKWPSYTRVNHAKYIVSDNRVNIGTSNMEWSYFYTTAGISVNTNHEPTRNAMEQVFLRNWNSSYATIFT